MKSFNLPKALSDEYPLRRTMLLYIVNIINHSIIKITQIGPDMHQRASVKMHKNTSPYVDDCQSKVRT